MARYLVEHKHRDDTCPAGNRERAQGLAGHITAASAATFGVRVLSDCVLPGEETLLMVVEADHPHQVAAFSAPFMGVGSVIIKPATTCDVVAAQAKD